MHGYLSEQSRGICRRPCRRHARDHLGIEFNPELDWDEREDLFKMSGKIVRMSNVTQSAVGNKDGLWTTVFAAAIFINEDNLAVEIGKSERDAGSGNEHAPRTYEVSTAH
jgi:pyruvoyl-dependent arginine decarboxylase (PvlArgDC)